MTSEILDVKPKTPYSKGATFNVAIIQEKFRKFTGLENAVVTIDDNNHIIFKCNSESIPHTFVAGLNEIRDINGRPWQWYPLDDWLEEAMIR